MRLENSKLEQGWSSIKLTWFLSSLLCLALFALLRLENSMNTLYYPKNVEVWKDIPGWVGYYQVSTFGNVRGVTRYVRHRFGGKQLLKKMVLKQTKKDKRFEVELNKKHSRKLLRVHTLVALAFIGPRPLGFDVCHEDGNSYNNTPHNLRYDTRSSNEIDKIKHGTSCKNKLKIEDVLFIKKLINSNNYSLTKISKIYKVTISCISSIKSGKTWAWLQ